MQIAVFVDAGYLFAQGSVALAGQKQPRNSTFITVDQALDRLASVATQCAPAARLLRIYWYDGVVGGRLSSTQEQLAGAAKCKLRLGLVNSAGEQKGVDSLIVTDLIELARNRAITDAVLLAGDEDLRIGVQIAQSFGVQVHLVGIKPARGSQSLELIREADQHFEWGAEDVGAFMKVELGVEPTGHPVVVADIGLRDDGVDETQQALLEKAVGDTYMALTDLQKETVCAAFRANPQSVPPEVDRKMLPIAGTLIGRRLEDSEKRKLRDICTQYLLNVTQDDN